MINSRNIDDLMPSVAANVRIFVSMMAAKGYKVAFSCVLRDQEKQTELHNTIGAPSLVSFHWGGGKGKGLAFDIYQDAPTFALQWQDTAFWKAARAILSEIGFSPVPGEESHSQWDGRKVYTSAMVRAGNLPPPMPLYKAAETDKYMNIVKGSTANETKLIRGIQTATGANADGLIGAQTLSDIACKLNAECFPLTLKLYGAPTIISNDFNVIAYPKSGLSTIPNSSNGSFLSGRTIWSICISHGVVIRGAACHEALGYPESVLYRLNGGAFGIARVKTVAELPSNISWAVGGMGLLGNYSPSAEGFRRIGTQDFSDVLRDTNHVMIGVKNNHTYQVFCESMTASQVNALAKTLGLEMAIMLDGGHLAAMNGAETFAKKNTAQAQYYVIQGI